MPSPLFLRENGACCPGNTQKTARTCRAYGTGDSFGGTEIRPNCGRVLYGFCNAGDMRELHSHALPHISPNI